MELTRNPKELQFLYRTCSVRPKVLTYWITRVPEFYDELYRMKHGGEPINDPVLLDVMQTIYDNKVSYVERTGERIDFSFQTASRTIRQLKQSIEERGDNN